jgi:predicted alpha/beta-hydrolase family hydrolase
MDAQPLELEGPEGKLAALWLRPERAELAVVVAHGAGAGMRHRFLEAFAQRLFAAGVASLRYEFPYRTRGSARPDPPERLHAAVRAAVGAARALAPELPLFAGGKSFGGRMTSQSCAARPLAGVCGLFFVGFPLHPAGRPGRERAHHLAEVTLPMLFLAGTRDALADLTLLREVVAELGSRATLHVVDGADHGFAVLKRSGCSDALALEELALTLRAWAARSVVQAAHVADARARGG